MAAQNNLTGLRRLTALHPKKNKHTKVELKGG